MQYGVSSYRAFASWKDERYKEGNEGRLTDCKSGEVTWTETGQYWLPNFFTLDVLEIVSMNMPTA